MPKCLVPSSLSRVNAWANWGRSRGAAEYQRIEAEIFRDLPLRDHSEGDLI